MVQFKIITITQNEERLATSSNNTCMINCRAVRDQNKLGTRETGPGPELRLRLSDSDSGLGKRDRDRDRDRVNSF